MKKKVLFLLTIYAVTVVLFLGAKVVFMLCHGGGHDVSLADGLSVLRHGLSLDLSTALYLLIVPLLACLASVWVRVPRWLLRAYFAVVALALALAFVADTSLYAFWGFKLDASCLQYLSQPEGITQSVSLGYLLLRLLLIIVLTATFFYIYDLLIFDFRFDSSADTYKEKNYQIENRKSVNRKSNSRSVNRKSNSRSVNRKFLHTLLYILLMPLMVIGIRGGFDKSTTNIGQVYSSQNQFLNHAAVNPVFSFLYSLMHQTGDLSDYDFMDDGECQRLTRDVYTTESVGTDTLLTTTRPAAIVIILLESAGEQFADAMPHLQQLKQEGVNFSRCYANSWRTDRGTVALLSGYPTFPTLSVMKMPEKTRSLPAIARTLGQQGYATSYLYGGDINFTNMRSYLIGTSWQQLTSMDDYSRDEQHSAEWGVRDDITFNTLYQQLSSLHPSPSTNYPPSTLIGYSTLSSHEPWDVPERPGGGPWLPGADEVLNAFAYVDHCLYDFVERLRQTPLWQSTLIVITADHGINHGSIGQQQPLQKNHIPMLWLGGAVREPRTVDVICNQSDLAATLLAQLQLPHDDFRFSRDVLSATYRHPTAVNNYNNAQWIADSTGHLLYDFTARQYTVSQAAQPDSLLSLSKAMLQLTTHDLLQR